MAIKLREAYLIRRTKVYWQIIKTEYSMSKYKKINILKGEVRTYGNDYRVTTLSTLYLINFGIIMLSLKSIGKFYHALNMRICLYTSGLRTS